MSVKTNRETTNETASRPDDAGGVLLGRPTVAANSGTVITSKLLRAFEAAGLGGAEWMRLPAPRARCRLSGLSRTGLNEADERGDIKTITVRQPDAQRGVKLINVASLRAWLARLDAEQNSPDAHDQTPGVPAGASAEGGEV